MHVNMYLHVFVPTCMHMYVYVCDNYTAARQETNIPQDGWRDQEDKYTTGQLDITISV